MIGGSFKAPEKGFEMRRMLGLRKSQRQFFIDQEDKSLKAEIISRCLGRNQHV